MFVYEIGDYTNGLALHKVERPDPEPGHGQVVMKVHATGVNARDLSIMEGALHINKMPFTRVPLSDNAGEVLKVGPGVTRVKPGDRITMTHYWQWLDGAWHADMAKEDFGATRDGFLAEQVLIPEAPILKLPASLSYEDACTLQSPGLTAWNAVVEAGQTGPSDTVVTLGTGSVSVFGLQWAKMVGARVIVTSSSDDKLAKLKNLGADEGIKYRTTPDWAEAGLELTGGEGANVVLNTVGMAEVYNCLMAAASGGRVMHIGANPVVHGEDADSPPPALTRLPNLILKDLTMKGIIVGSRRMFADMLTAMVRHDVKPVIDKVFGFDEIYDAVDYMKGGTKFGKVVIKIT